MARHSSKKVFLNSPFHPIVLLFLLLPLVLINLLVVNKRLAPRWCFWCSSDFSYILSLALADLLVIVTTVPLTSTVYTFPSWPYGSLLCTVSEFTKDVSIGVSVFTLTALSGDRFFAIVDPLRKFHIHSEYRVTSPQGNCVPTTANRNRPFVTIIGRECFPRRRRRSEWCCEPQCL